MSLRESCSTQQDNADDVCAGKPGPLEEKLADTLQSQVINAFEAAIYQGMRPKDALAVILTWMSSEMMRIQASWPA